MQKWEYCQISHGKSHNWTVSVYTSGGIQKRDYRHNPGEHEDEKARIFSQLGDEGWELVSNGLFKRPKVEPESSGAPDADAGFA